MQITKIDKRVIKSQGIQGLEINKIFIDEAKEIEKVIYNQLVSLQHAAIDVERSR